MAIRSIETLTSWGGRATPGQMMVLLPDQEREGRAQGMGMGYGSVNVACLVRPMLGRFSLTCSSCLVYLVCVKDGRRELNVDKEVYK
jgi:hypothetical protein